MKNKQGKQRSVAVIGVDTETCEGPPFTFQFYSEDIYDEPYKRLVFIDKQKPSRQFFTMLNELPNRKNFTYVMYGFNLSFDLLSFLYDKQMDLVTDSKFCIEQQGWKIEGVYSQLVFARCSKKGKTVWIIDAAAFLKGSLAKLAKIFCPHLPKLKMPAKLGKIKYKPSNKQFCDYAMRDAVIAYHIGSFIDQMHEQYDVKQCFSVAHFSATIFRHKFLQNTIPLPPMKIVYSALHAYHGGKNNITVKPGWYKNIYSYDIKSAYPYAMYRLPSFAHSDLYKSVKGTGHPSSLLPEFGIYKVTGHAKPCKWPILYTHNFKPIAGDFAGVWTTGPELNEGLKSGELKIESIEGYYYDADKDTDYSPFKAFVDDFFKKKDTATTKTLRLFYKIIMNSLYGKFIQTRKDESSKEFGYDLDENKIYEKVDLVAGGLFNPFIAALITGHTRAYIHKLEHKYKAIHTSTDGIFTQMLPKVIPGLGGLHIDAQGDCMLFRNKVYIIYGKKSDTSIPSAVYKNKHIVKFATHGFRGKIDQLEQIGTTGKPTYNYIKVNKLKESIRRNLVPNKFDEYHAILRY